MNRRGSGAEGSTPQLEGRLESDEYRSRSEPRSPPGAPQRAEAADDLLDEADDPSADEAAPEGPVDLLVAAQHHGDRLDRWLAHSLARHSRSHLQSLIEAGAVTIDGIASQQPSRKVAAGQRVRVMLSLPLSQRPFEPQPMALDIRQQDAHFYVLCKPPGLVVHPAAGHWSGTLLNGLLALDPGLASLPRAGIVHRLDKDTSGLMVVARTVLAMTALVRSLAAHEVRREYQALVHGTVSASLARVDLPLGRDPRSRVRMAVVGSGKPARTDIRRVGEDGRFSAVECRLHTGRTHQIRVHLSHVGHPLVADSLYGGAEALGMTRQALHARQLAFKHPAGGAPVRVQAQPPADFQSAWERVVADGTG